MKSEEFNKEWSKENHDFIGKNPSRVSRIKFAEDYLQHRFSEESIMKVLNEFIFRVETQEGNKLTVIDVSDFKEIAEQLLKQQI